MPSPKKSSPDQPLCFTHIPVAPYVPSEPQHSTQRYFSRSGNNSNYYLSLGRSQSRWPSNVSVEVFRFAPEKFAELRLNLHLGEACETTMYVGMTATELRHVATLMLDAAHDLDTNHSEILSMARSA